MKTLHFTIGPVQGFVAQSRRTRDLLASSFMLSYLAGHGMVDIIRAGGEIQFPHVQESHNTHQEKQIVDSLLQAINETVDGSSKNEGPWIGSLPNRFRAKVPASYSPEDCVEAVRKAWLKVADTVYDHYVREVAPTGRNTEEIWKRQVSQFWDMAWVVGEEADLLDRRKNWRSYVPSVEPGDKCTLMGNLQELSGWLRIHERKQQITFWEQMRQRVASYDLEENERLCAIGLIKRLFPSVAKKAIGWPFSEEALYFPSTSYLAALPWMTKAVRAQPELAESFAECARNAGIREIGKTRSFPVLNQLESETKRSSLLQLEGTCFYKSNLENDRYWEENHYDSTLQEELGRKLTALANALGESPSPYYALLLMDGDRLGALLQELGGVKVSRALSKFTNKVKDHVNSCNGVTIYAGGDDVLALVPIEGVLPAAVKLRNQYQEAFQSVEKQAISATISSAIVYAHYKAPLQYVLEFGHQLLDEKAKKESGRDSLAVGVWKSGGPSMIWSAPWQTVYSSPSNQTVIEELVEKFRGASLYSSGFFYKLREHYESLDTFSEDHQENAEILTALIAAEYLRSVETPTTITSAEAEERVKKLVHLCLHSWRDEQGIVHEGEAPFRADAALLIRFLGQRGGEGI